MEKPTAFFLAQSRIDDVNAPDCDTSASGPGEARLTGHAGVELQVRPLKTQAVGAQQVNAVAGGHFVQVCRQRGIDAAGDHQGRPAFDAPGNFQRGGHLGGRQRNDGQISVAARPDRPGCHWHECPENTSLPVKRCAVMAWCKARACGGLCFGLVGLACKHHNRGR